MRGLACAAALGMAACAGESSRGADAPIVTVRDSAGIRIVENRMSPDAVPVYAELGPADLEIGVVDGDVAYSFTSVSAARTLPDGGILVVESRAQELRIFDRGGAHVRTLGRSGSGPGEFTQIGSLADLRGDTVLVWDTRALRLSTFLLDGRFVGDRVLDGERLPSTRTATRLPDGSLLLEGLVFPAVDADAEDLRMRGLVRRLDPSGRIDTVAVTPGAEVAVGEEMSTVIEGRTRTVRLMLQSLISYEAHVAVAAEHFFLGQNDRYRIERRSHRGVPDLIVEAPDLERPLEASEVAEIERRRLDRCDNEQCVRASEFSFERFDPPEWRPAFSDLQVDALGSLWVAGWEPTDVPVGAWHVFSHDGELLGRVAVPQGLRIHEIGTDYVLGVVVSDLEVPFVRRFPLTRLR